MMVLNVCGPSLTLGGNCIRGAGAKTTHVLRKACARYFCLHQMSKDPDPEPAALRREVFEFPDMCLWMKWRNCRLIWHLHADWIHKNTLRKFLNYSSDSTNLDLKRPGKEAKPRAG
jgi:hypothetical protein